MSIYTYTHIHIHMYTWPVSVRRRAATQACKGLRADYACKDICVKSYHVHYSKLLTCMYIMYVMYMFMIYCIYMM